MTERKRLTDILLLNSDRERLEKAWRETQAAAEFAPLPKGDYTFRILSGELFTSKRGTAGYKLTLEVTEGDFEGRRAWCDFWLTPAALPMTKRDLAKIEITDLNQLELPLPPGILIRGKLAIRRDDDGYESNRLVRFECIGTEPGDAFEPKADGGDQGGDAADTSFAFGANAPPSEGAALPASSDGIPPAAKGEQPPGANGAATRPKRSRKKADAARTEGGAGQ
jgi:hypothetical protein